MPFEKKLFSVHLVGETDARKPMSQLSTCSNEEGAPLASLYTLLCLYLYILCTEIKCKDTQLQDGGLGKARQESSYLPTPLLTTTTATSGPRRCLLRTSTGGAEG